MLPQQIHPIISLPWALVLIFIFASGTFTSFQMLQAADATVAKSTSPKQIVFEPWGKSNNLSLKTASNGSSNILILQGETDVDAAGFVTNGLNYKGSNIVLRIGNVSKSPEDAKVSFTLDVKGLFKNYTMILL
jgi:hypothetical protein